MAKPVAIGIRGGNVRTLAAVGVWWVFFVPTMAQTSEPTAGSNAGNASPGWIVRDPTTGQLFHQQLITVNTPTVRWENRQAVQTVYEPQPVTRVVPTQQTVYTPTTQYVMQSRVKGLWNPFRQPTMAYEYVPVTTWTPKVQTTQTAVSTYQWVPKQQSVLVPYPVTETETRQQLVQTPVPGSRPTLPSQNVVPQVRTPFQVAYQRAPLISIPLVPPRLPQNMSPSMELPPAVLAHSTSASGLRPVVRPTGLRNPLVPTYDAPLQTASASGSASRDSLQSGMSATVLR